jgi:hypothetical protein
MTVPTTDKKYTTWARSLNRWQIVAVKVHEMPLIQVLEAAILKLYEAADLAEGYDQRRW